MIELFLSENDPSQLVVKERMENMGLACKVVVDNSRKNALIKEKGERYETEDAILKYMDELEVFYRNWYACRCED